MLFYLHIRIPGFTMIQSGMRITFSRSDGGHMEPSIQEQYSPLIEAYLGMQNHDIEMAREIWNFLKTKTL